MIACIFYIAVAAVSVFGMCVGKIKTVRKTVYNEDFFFLAPVLCGIAWPIGAPLYGAYIAAVWFSEKEE